MKIEVYIKDENDNKPTCDRANLIVRKRFENITLQHLKDICHDDDIGEENQITGFLLQSNDCGSNGKFIKFMPYLSRIRKKQQKQVSFHYIFWYKKENVIADLENLFMTNWISHNCNL